MGKEQNKKLTVLIVLGIFAIFSLIRGCTAPGKGKRVSKIRSKSSQAVIKERKNRLSFARRDAKESSYPSWGRDPFTLKETKLKSFVLNGILWDKNNPNAMINGDIVGLGDEINGKKVIEIKKNSVILKDNTGSIELRLGEKTSIKKLDFK